MGRHVTRFISVFLTFFVSASAATGQSARDIELDPAIECWFHSEFPTLTALVVPPEGVVQSRLYFRCSLYPDYYFVDLQSDGTGFSGIAPQAEASCPQVHYYVEMLRGDFTSARTAERIADVTDPGECRRRFPAAAFFTGENPRIVLGSTVAGPAFAPGFSEVGISGFISAAGASSTVATGAGLSTGVLAGVAAGGAAAGIGVVVANQSATTPSPPVAGAPPPPPPPPPPPTTTSVPASPGPTQAVKACFTLDPPNGKVETNEALTIDGRCSEGGSNLTFHYDLGDGRTKDAQAFVTAIWPQPGIYTLTLTVTRPGSVLDDTDSVSRAITVERPAEPDPEPEPPGEPVHAAFSSRNLEPEACFAEFDASASRGDIVAYRWELDTPNAFGLGVVTAEGRVVRHDWGTACYRADGVSVARLTVVGRNGSTDTVEQEFNALGFLGIRAGGWIQSSVAVELLGAGAASIMIQLPDGTSRSVSAGATTPIGLKARPGKVVLDLVASSAAEGPVLVRLDFTGARGFVAGGMRVVSGQMVARDSYALVLRFEGGAGERARVELELMR